jgi:tRNA (cytidine/uridine-2'-O-)-methyltransferase
MPIDIALFQPDIAQNTGTTIRTAACFGSHIHIIEPCGFVFNDKKFKRSGMDYIDNVDITRHNSWEHFYKWAKDNDKRLVLMTTKTDQNYTHFSFSPQDILLAGRETAGVPDEVHNACHYRVTIPMRNELRSLNVAIATAIILSEGIRQVSLV